ncbi:MAG TPA: VWA domain-containing protein [Gaiellaceae bacterium]
MSFGHPLLLLTLLLVPAAVVAYRLLERRRARYAVRYTNVAVLEQVLGRALPWRRWLTGALALLALATLCVAVARPHVHTTVVDDRATVVLVLDVSGSMHAVDVKPTRLRAAQAALHDFLDTIPSRLRVGLVLFAGEAQVATPPTREHQLVADAIDEADFFNGFGGTAIGDAIDLAVRVGVQSAGLSDSEKSALGATSQLASYVAAAPPTKSSLVSILFLSDGKQNRGIVPPLVGAQHARAAAVPVYTVALGTTGNTHLENGYMFGGGGFGFGGGRLAPDPKTLSAIAKITGGEFFPARTAHALQDAYRTLGSRLGQRHAVREVTDLFALGAALLLVLGAGLAAWWAPRLP